MTARVPELSVIIPAYNEEKRLGRALERIESYFASKPSGIGPDDVEVIVVDVMVMVVGHAPSLSAPRRRQGRMRCRDPARR